MRSRRHPEASDCPGDRSAALTKKPSQEDVDAFRAIAKDIQNGTVQDLKRLVAFSRLG